jgi:hypothetical protein
LHKFCPIHFDSVLFLSISFCFSFKRHLYFPWVVFRTQIQSKYF